MPDDPATNPSKEAFTDLLSHLERLETQTGAILQFLKDNGTITDDKLAPYLEQASKASDVRMRAARARLNHLFTSDESAKPSTEAVPAPNQREGQSTPQPEEKHDAEKESAPQTRKAESPDKKAPVNPNDEAAQKSAPPPKKEPSEIIAGRAAEKEPKKKDAA